MKIEFNDINSYKVTYLNGESFIFKSKSIDDCVISALFYAMKNKIPKVITSIELDGKLICKKVEIVIHDFEK